MPVNKRKVDNENNHNWQSFVTWNPFQNYDVDFHIELGRQYFDEYPPILVVTDEIGPANSQIWDLEEHSAQSIKLLTVNDIAERLALAPGN